LGASFENAQCFVRDAVSEVVRHPFGVFSGPLVFGSPFAFSHSLGAFSDQLGVFRDPLRVFGRLLVFGGSLGVLGRPLRVFSGSLGVFRGPLGVLGGPLDAFRTVWIKVRQPRFDGAGSWALKRRKYPRI
jgi:hypothetical protein